VADDAPSNMEWQPIAEAKAKDLRRIIATRLGLLSFDPIRYNPPLGYRRPPAPPEDAQNSLACGSNQSDECKRHGKPWEESTT
jgi:hypothetical protein